MIGRSISVRAQVVDADSYSPRSSDTLLVDTNVWVWFAYAPNAMTALQQAYPRAIKRAITAGAAVYHLDLSLCELAHVIERTEWETSARTSQAGSNLKDYRYSKARSATVAQIATAWKQVTAVSKPLQCMDGSEAILHELQSAELDGYDAPLVLAARKARAAILTDDCDVATARGIKVVTKNAVVLRALKTGKGLRP